MTPLSNTSVSCGLEGALTPSIGLARVCCINEEVNEKYVIITVSSFFFQFLIPVELTYRVILVSGVQSSDSTFLHYRHHLQ